MEGESGRGDSASFGQLPKPSSAIGKLVLARVLLSESDYADAAREIRSVWRSAPLSTELEDAVLTHFLTS